MHLPWIDCRTILSQTHGSIGRDVMTDSCQNILRQYFNVLGIFDLNQYSRNMWDLYDELRLISRSHYEHSDRIVFTLFDHDFYLDNQGPGWTLYNLQLILADLDISNFFCLLLTNQPHYDDLTRWAQTNLTNDAFPIRSITTLLNKDFFPNRTSTRDPHMDQIEKPYCVLSRQSRPHRTFFISKLWKANLFESGIVGYNNIAHPLVQSNNRRDPKHSVTGLCLLDIPFAYQKVLLRNQSNRHTFAEFDNLYPTYKNFVDSVDVTDKDQCSILDTSTPIAKALLYVALETEIATPKVFVSRISLRGILERRPFVIFGCAGILDFLKSRGFKTFGDFWDESYDDVVDFEIRAEKIINVIEYISSMTPVQLTQMYQNMRTIVDYNYDFYHAGLAAQETTLLNINCAKNLDGE